MAENALVPFVAATVVAVGVATAIFVLYSRNRPALLEGPLAAGVSVIGITAGVVALLVGEAAHGAEMLVYVGGVVAVVGVAALTGVVALVPHPEGEDAEHGH
jgi:hypothetical protein